MCEFKVFSDGRLAAEDIVCANSSDGALILKDVLGSSTKVDNCVIAEIDVAKETMVLKKASIIGDMLRFVDTIARCEEAGKYDRDLEDIWQRAKSQGDEAIRDLWMRYQKPRRKDTS